jgi:hypothetical protein
MADRAPREIRQRRRTHGRIARAMRTGVRAAVLIHDGRAGAHVTADSATALARSGEETHVSRMQTLTKTDLVGFMELQVGSLAVQVPIRSAEPTPTQPLASFEVEGNTCAILIRGDTSSKAVERAMGEAAKQAMAHLSRKLLN